MPSQRLETAHRRSQGVSVHRHAASEEELAARAIDWLSSGPRAGHRPGVDSVSTCKGTCPAPAPIDGSLAILSVWVFHTTDESLVGPRFRGHRGGVRADQVVEALMSAAAQFGGE